MPELPEVETTVVGIAPLLINQRIKKIVVRNKQLRWPVTNQIELIAKDRAIKTVKRRAKYIVVDLDHGSFLIHLGMSGSLRLISEADILKKHDHIQMYLSNDYVLTYHDPRRFGCWLWSNDDHKLLDSLGPEPLSNSFDGLVINLTPAMDLAIHLDIYRDINEPPIPKTSENSISES